MRRAGRNKPEHLAALDRVREWVRARFNLGEGAIHDGLQLGGQARVYRAQRRSVGVHLAVEYGGSGLARERGHAD